MYRDLVRLLRYLCLGLHVSGVTQSFVHALISDLFRKYGSGVLDKISFKACNEKVRKIVSMVTDYMQECYYSSLRIL